MMAGKTRTIKAGAPCTGPAPAVDGLLTGNCLASGENIGGHRLHAPDPEGMRPAESCPGTTY